MARQQDRQTTLEKTRLQGEYALRKEAMRGATSLTAEQIEGLYRALTVADKALSSLDDAGAKRGSQFSALASRYDTAVNAGMGAASVRGAVDLARLRVMAPIEFAKAAYMPDFQTLQVVQDAVKGLGSANPKSAQVARLAWQAYLRAVKTGEAGNDLGTYREMVETYGDPTALAFGPNEGGLAEDMAGLKKAMATAEASAAAFDQAYQGLGESWNTWLSKQRATNPNIDPEADSTYDAFMRDTKLDVSALPQPSSVFVDNIKKVAANPAEYPEVFSDIAESRKRWEGRRTDLEARLDRVGGAEEQTPTASDDPRAILAGWVRRPDVQWWAKENGFNLGTAEVITPELQKEIDEGRYPNSVFVNGLMYNPSPDDMRAIRFASKQMDIDPQKNVLYAAGLSGRDGPRRIMDVEVTGEAPRAVQMTSYGDEAGGFGSVVRLSDGTYRARKDGDTAWTELPAAAGEQLFAQAADIADVDEVIPGVPAKTRRIQMEYRKPLYGKDPEGSVRGVDLETGRTIVIPQEQVVSRTFVGETPLQQTVAERMTAAGARRTAKREGLDVSTEAQNEMDIGEKPDPQAVKARADAVQKSRTGEGPDRAARAADAAADRADKEVERLSALYQQDRQANPQRAAMTQKALLRAQARAKALRAEAAAQVEGAAPPLPVVPDASLYENFQPRTTTAAEQERQRARSTASQSLTPTGTVTFAAGQRDLPGKVLPAYIANPQAGMMQTAGDDYARDWKGQTPPEGVRAPAKPQAPATSAGTKTSAVVTPTASTTPGQLAAQRKAYETLGFRKMSGPGPRVAPGMVE
jgi:hypothetical protein